MTMIPVLVEFSGGLEILFGGKRALKLSLSPSPTGPATITDLVGTLCDKYMTDKRKDLFVIEDNRVRPGILVLVNDTDWELVGEQDYEIEPGDQILFASTLHGG
ncbi:ubiquitin-related modifier 1 [Limtongia smithiae]|uniref:ubiquitin-related modifier 1 n=1 Tax=Limtongia smithiae TaxID=1125753 RepID=UPI0034CEDF94